MVEYAAQLDLVFGSLADPTRRDIFKRVTIAELSVGDIAGHYKMSLAAISKHLKILEQAKLIRKRRNGRQQLVVAVPITLRDVQSYLAQYEQLWNQRFDVLEELLKEEQNHARS
ncbi:MAG: ArsR/SmtB family transcription factor [Candidatus Saccharibacteria bacterium]